MQTQKTSKNSSKTSQAAKKAQKESPMKASIKDKKTRKNVKDSGNVKAMRTLPKYLPILFKFIFQEKHLYIWESFFNKLFYYGFLETVKEQIRKLEGHFSKDRKEELAERQEGMKGMHLSDNKNLAFVYEAPCPQCSRGIEVIDQTNIKHCPHCGKEIKLKTIPFNTISCTEMYELLVKEGFNWNPDGFHWSLDQDSGKVVFVFPLVSYNRRVSVELFEETQEFLQTLLGMPSWLHPHGNMVPTRICVPCNTALRYDEDTCETCHDLGRDQQIKEVTTNGWSLSFLPRPPKKEQGEWVHERSFGDAASFIRIPSSRKRGSQVSRVCPKCTQSCEPGEDSCKKCSYTFPQVVKRFRSALPGSLGKGELLYRCPACKSPVTDRHLETGRRIHRCWNCNGKLGMWEADKAFDVDSDVSRQCTLCMHIYEGNPSHCPSCTTRIRWDDELEHCWHACPSSSCRGEFFGKAESCPSCNRGIDWNEDSYRLRPRAHLLAYISNHVEMYECKACSGRYSGKLSRCPHSECGARQVHKKAPPQVEKPVKEAIIPEKILGQFSPQEEKGPQPKTSLATLLGQFNICPPQEDHDDEAVEWKCPDCNIDVAPLAQKCPHCKAKIDWGYLTADYGHCPSCGNVCKSVEGIPCSSCGTPFTWGDDDFEFEPTKAPEKNPARLQLNDEEAIDQFLLSHSETRLKRDSGRYESPEKYEEIEPCICGMLIAYWHDVCPGCGEQFNDEALDGWEAIPADLLHLEYDEAPQEMTSTWLEWDHSDGLITALADECWNSDEGGLCQRGFDVLPGMYVEKQVSFADDPSFVSEYSLTNSSGEFHELSLDEVSTILGSLLYSKMELLVPEREDLEDEDRELSTWESYDPNYQPQVLFLGSKKVS